MKKGCEVQTRKTWRYEDDSDATFLHTARRFLGCHGYLSTSELLMLLEAIDIIDKQDEQLKAKDEAIDSALECSLRDKMLCTACIHKLEQALKGE
jgi:hypothetical protein